MPQQKTLQQLVDRVFNFLMKQGVASTNEIPGTWGYSGCAYRGTDGLKCAIGCLIRDSEYDPCMEGITPESIFCTGPLITQLGDAGIKYEKVLKRIMTEYNVTKDELQSLQNIHDDADGLSPFEARDFWLAAFKTLYSKWFLTLPKSWYTWEKKVYKMSQYSGQ